MEDVIIVGGGAAGLAAGLYSARYKLKTRILVKELGGAGNEAHLVDNWIGSPGIAGLELMDNFVKHVKSYDVPIETEEISKVSKEEDKFVLETNSGKKFESKTVIFANGMKHRKLGITGEKEYEGKGVHYCYTCDGPLYGGKTVALIGGSDSAALGALFMAEHAEKVYVIYRKSKIRAEPVSTEAVYNHPKIEVIHDTNLIEIYGEQFVTGVKTDTGKDIKLDGVFVEIGHLPQSDLPKQVGVEIDERGFVKVDSSFKTNVEGVFAAGDITNATSLKQFITSAAQGSIAAQTAYLFLK